jgi:hypothetical protein
MNAQEKQAKYEWLAEFYAKAAKEPQIQFNFIDTNGWADTNAGPHPSSNIDRYRIKPTLKVIDLTPLIGSGILCEFEDDGDTAISPLASIILSSPYPFTGNQGLYIHCSPLMSPYIHYWRGESDKCPIPEGFEVVLHFRNGDPHECNGGRYSWNHKLRNSDIIGIEFIAVKEGYTLAAQ